jgi:hypothetical protein
MESGGEARRDEMSLSPSFVDGKNLRLLSIGRIQV